MAGFAPADALRRKYIADPRRDLLDELRAGLDQATTDTDREAMRAAAVEAAVELAAGDLDTLDALNHAIFEAVDGPEPFAVIDPDYIDPVTGGKGKIRDLASFIAESPDFAAVADAVATAQTQLEAAEIVDAAIAGDRDLWRSGADPASLTWTLAETQALNGLLATVPDDGSVQAAAAAKAAADNAGLNEMWAALTRERGEDESVLDAEVASAEVTA